jgi:hypothetical protein
VTAVKGLAAAGGHLDQGARAVGGQGLFEVGNGFDLGRLQALGNQWGQMAQAAAQRVGLAGPPGQRLGPVEGEGAPAARVGVEAVGEIGFDPGALVEKGERLVPGWRQIGQAQAVLLGLVMHPAQGGCPLSWPRLPQWPCRRRTADSRRSRSSAETRAPRRRVGRGGSCAGNPEPASRRPRAAGRSLFEPLVPGCRLVSLHFVSRARFFSYVNHITFRLAFQYSSCDLVIISQNTSSACHFHPTHPHSPTGELGSNRSPGG